MVRKAWIGACPWGRMIAWCLTGIVVVAGFLTKVILAQQANYESFFKEQMAEQKEVVSAIAEDLEKTDERTRSVAESLGSMNGKLDMLLERDRTRTEQQGQLIKEVKAYRTEMVDWMLRVEHERGKK